LLRPLKKIVSKFDLYVQFLLQVSQEGPKDRSNFSLRIWCVDSVLAIIRGPPGPLRSLCTLFGVKEVLFQ